MGSGLGNQLHRYIATRVLARDNGFDFGMICPENFKGSFMKIDMGKPIDAPTNPPVIMSLKTFIEKKVVENGIDVRSYDPEINFVEDNTIIDGEFQDPRYFMHRIAEVRDWLQVEPIRMWDNVCVINFRGGEYVGVKDLFLTRDYWDAAIAEMRKTNHEMKFEVHTDDEATARQFFPDFVVKQDIGLNWRSIRYAHYLILSNSSFAILPALLNQEVKKVIAPRYWSRRSLKVWALPQNYYPGWTYL